MIIRSLLLLTALLIPVQSFAFDHTHSAFTSVLQQHVKMLDQGRVSKIDYRAIQKTPFELNAYLNSLSDVSKAEFEAWTRDEQLAFLINVYNAFTIDLIIKNYPVTSIRKIGSLGKNPWKIEFVRLLGETVSLDEIEHGMIRKKGVYDEPRIHFALVCASIGCPALLNTAFTREKLEPMLEQGLVGFLSDKTRNRFNHKAKRFEVSKIFKWYGGDFNEKYGSVIGLLHQYSRYLVSEEGQLSTAIKAKKIKYLDYDWNLNIIE